MPRIAADPGTVRAALASDIVLAGGWGFLSGLLPIDLADDRVPLPEGVERQAADRLPARSCVGVSHLPRGAQIAMDFVLSATLP